MKRAKHKNTGAVKRATLCVTCPKLAKEGRLQNKQLNRKVANWQKQEAAITLIALVVTIVVLVA